MDAGGRATQGAVAESFANWVTKPELGNQRNILGKASRVSIDFPKVGLKQAA